MATGTKKQFDICFEDVIIEVHSYVQGTRGIELDDSEYLEHIEKHLDVKEVSISGNLGEAGNDRLHYLNKKCWEKVEKLFKEEGVLNVGVPVSKDNCAHLRQLQKSGKKIDSMVAIISKTSAEDRKLFFYDTSPPPQHNTSTERARSSGTTQRLVPTKKLVLRLFVRFIKNQSEIPFEVKLVGGIFFCGVVIVGIALAVNHSGNKKKD